ncbi:MAG: hypothetical protein OXI33_02825 [Chloroflexota bacterium]|nr:hypothetical protein [Chloroflexota bacterium]
MIDDERDQDIEQRDIIQEQVPAPQADEVEIQERFDAGLPAPAPDDSDDSSGPNDPDTEVIKNLGS